MAKDIRWGMIGCGRVAEVKSGPSYQQAAGSRLAAVASKRPEAARDYARRHGIQLVFDDVLEMIHSPDVDAVYVATPPASHLSLALHVARAGKPCCVEKPIALSYPEALEMTAAFERAGQPLFVAYYRRSLPRFLQIRDWLCAGVIGPVRHIDWKLTRSPSDNDLAGNSGWRTDPTAAPGGYFDDLACHGLDLFDYLLGAITDVSGVQSSQQELYRVSDAFAASWLHSCGATGTAMWNFASPFRHDFVTITGAVGEIRFSVFDEHDLILRTASGEHRMCVANPSPIQFFHVERMVTSLQGGSEHPSTGFSAARTARVMDQILSR